MAYCTSAEVQGTSGNSWKDGNLIGISTTVMSATSVTARITKADAIIDAKLSRKYTVPFTSTPPLINQISKDIASYFIVRDLFTKDSQNKNDWVETFRLSIQMLDDIADGKIRLVDSSGDVITQIAGDTLSSNTESYPVESGRDDIENWEQSSNMLDDRDDDRDE